MKSNQVRLTQTKTIELERIEDSRGELVPLDFDQLPFAPVRVFVIRNVPEGTERGGHSNMRQQQLFVCLHGEIEVTLEQEGRLERITIRPGAPGLLIASGVWSSQRYVKPDSVLLVLADDHYDPANQSADRDPVCS